MSRFSGHRRVFADAGFLIALFSKRDDLHERAEELFRDAVRERVEIHSSWPVVGEAVTLLLYHYGYSEAAAVLKALPGFRVHAPAEAEFRSAAALFPRHAAGRKVSFVDLLSYSIVTGRLKGIPVLSFDADFPALGMTVIR
ncbi:MAG: hypothetical protein M1550_04545 [Deltaproteobacteria bacterium]|nr:hypothetical protein [Deltaproteobacteria bacterium]